MSTPQGEVAGLIVPERFIPTPRTVSRQAQAFLSYPMPFANDEPDPTDKAAWHAHIEKSNARVAAITAARAERFSSETVEHKTAKTTLYEIVPRTLPRANESRAVFYVHGGGFTVGGGIAAAHAATPIAGANEMRAFAVDYRMPPDHPYPAALDDAVEAYRFVLERYEPANIAVMGDSAGGGLAAGFLLKARDIGLPMPAACVLHTPEADLTESGDTFETNRVIDIVLQKRLSNSIRLYADGHDLKDPYLSPVFGDFGKGFPPTILTSGTRDLFLSNTVLLHRALRRARIEAELHVFEAMPHGGFFDDEAPESVELRAEQVRFVREHLGDS